jgi:hypothetical protein
MLVPPRWGKGHLLDRNAVLVMPRLQYFEVLNVRFERLCGLAVELLVV